MMDREEWLKIASEGNVFSYGWYGKDELIYKGINILEVIETDIRSTFYKITEYKHQNKKIKTNSLRRTLKYALIAAYTNDILKRRGNEQTDLSTLKNRIIFIPYHSETNVQIMQPIAEKLGKEAMYLYIDHFSNNRLKKRLEQQRIHTVSIDQFISTHKLNSHQEIFKNWLTISKALPIEYRANSFFTFTLDTRVLEAMRYIDALYEAYRELKPTLIILAGDIEFYGRIAALVAKMMNIPSLLLQHGYYSEYTDKGYMRTVICDKMAVWGRRTYDIYKSFGVPEEKLILTGSPLFYPIRYAPISSSKPFILFASQCYPDQYSILIKALQKIASDKDLPELVIKLHPLEQKDSYHGIEFTDKITINHIDPLNELISRCALLITIDSTVTLEAAYAGKPTINLNLTGFQPSPFKEIAIEINKLDDLIPIIKKLYKEEYTLDKHVLETYIGPSNAIETILSLIKVTKCV